MSLTGVVIDAADPAPMAIISAAPYRRNLSPGRPRGTNMFTPFHRGDLLQIQGVTDPGNLRPLSPLPAPLERLAPQRFPPAQPVTYQQLITGALDGQWVEIKGVIRQCYEPYTNTGLQRIIIAADGGLLRYILPLAKPIPFSNPTPKFA